MARTPGEPDRRADRIGLSLGLAALLAMTLWLAGWTGSGQGSAAIEVIWILLTQSGWAAAWVGAAIGLGRPLRWLLARDAREALALQVGLGVAVMLILDAALGTLGLLQAAGGAVAWTLLGVGLLCLLDQIRLWMARRRGSGMTLAAPPWLVWTTAPSLAVLLLAACSAPGWLWDSEFGGYDVLSYHLQVPKEWLALGRIEPLEHNVYSFLPSYVEAAYYHLAVLIGDGIDSVYAAQLLHAFLAILAAVLIARLAFAVAGRTAAAVVFVAVLGTPWVVVVGSLAYDEMAVALLLAAGGLAMVEKDVAPGPRGAMLGLLSAAACGAKLTAVGTVVLPLGLTILLWLPPRRWLVTLGAAAMVGLVGLLPYLLRNWLSAGNPVFPFATGLFALGHWSAEQAAIWGSAHSSGLGVLGRLAELWNQFFRYGMGANPHHGEPWLEQWSILPWLGMLGGLLAWRSASMRRAAAWALIVLAVQIIFWMTLTHLKSRFMLPAVVPLALGVGVGSKTLLDRIRRPVTRRRITVALAVAALLWACLPVLCLHAQRDGAPAAMIGLDGTLTGDDLTGEQRATIGARGFPTVAVNHLLPAGSRVLLVGEARGLYYRAAVTYQTTWDRGPLSRALDQTPDDVTSAIDVVQQEGYTHLLIDPAMLRLWDEAGWGDPRLTPDRLLAALDARARRLQEFPGGMVLYDLDRPGAE